MKNFNLSNLFIPLVAALAIYFPMSGAFPSPETAQQIPAQMPAQASGAAQPPPAIDHGKSQVAADRNRLPGEAARLLCDFFGDYLPGDSREGQPNGFPLNIDPASVKGDYCLLKRGIKTDFNLDFLLATIPDPKDSRLDHLFDRGLDGIQRAIESAGYVLDRYYLPWEKSKSTASAMATATATPVATSGTTAAMNAPAQTTPTVSRNALEPGVLVFRKTNKGISLLVLFLVGETPTYGIHKLAFQNALAQIEQLSMLAPPRPLANIEQLSMLGPPGPLANNPCPSITGQYVRILGPTFSGTATSLALSLKSWIERPKSSSNPLSKACLISGTALTIKKEIFRETTGHKNDVEFFATVIPEQEARKAFIQHLVDENKPLFFGGQSRILPRGEAADADRIHIAQLSEANTSYGQSAINAVAPRTRTVRPPTPTPSVSPTPALLAMATPIPSPSPTPRILSLTFPLHISQLRIEAAKVRNGHAELPNGLSLKEGNLALPMGEAGDQKPKDIVQSFSAMEAVTTELVLSEILSTIHRGRISYVGLSATDVLDRIFLIHEIREQCPNAVIFTFSSDLIYLHSEANLDAQGVLVITPYPLFAQNQFLTYPFEGSRARLQFTTQGAQGVYNAALALLGEPNLLLEYGEPLQPYQIGTERKPALWLAIVGRNGIWPVTTLKYDDPDNYVWRAKVVPAKLETIGGSSSEASPLVPQVGLVQNSQSAFSLGFLLLIGIICLVPSVVLLAQLLLFSIEQEDKSAGQPDSPKLNLAKRIGSRILRTIRWLIGKLGLLGLARQFKRGRVGQIFGDEDFYHYRFVRRIYLMACCATLLTITLFASGVSILPQRMGIKLPVFSNDWWQNQIITYLSYATLGFAFVAFAWLFVSIFFWVAGNRDQLRRSGLAAISLSIGLLMVGLATLGLYEVFYQYERYQKILFFLRTTEMSSGVSLLMPVALIGLASFLTFYSAVRRINLAERMACLPRPQDKIAEVPAFLRFDHGQTKSFNGVSNLESRLRELIVGRNLSGGTAFWVTILVLGIYGSLFLLAYTPSVDGKLFDFFFKVVFYIVPLLLIWAFLRFLYTWIELRRLLRRLSWHPLFARFAAMHSEEKRFSTLPVIDLLSPPPTYTALSLLTRQAKQFYRELIVPVEKQETLLTIKQLVEDAEGELSQAMLFDSQGNWQKTLIHRRDCEELLAKLSGHVSELLESTWESTAGQGPDGGELQAWPDEGKFFLLAHTGAFLQHIFAHLQNLVALVTAGLLLVLLASNSYPFQPRQPLLMFSWVTILTVVIVTLLVFVQMSRDKVLSLLSGTTPGKLNVTRDFMARVLIHGIIPIVALLGAQFPDTLRRIFSWLSAFQGGSH